jgi:hypothetical protein
MSLLLLAGCARHVVVEREAGRIDGAKSISSYSDTQWTIVHPPAAAAASPEARSPIADPRTQSATPRR